MNSRHLFLTLSSILFTACGSGSTVTTADTADSASQSTKPDFSRSDIIAAIYDKDYTVPADFLVDERAGTVDSYSLYHVKDSSVSYELCSSDFETARQLEQADNDSRAVNGHFVDSYENDLYYEFIRELSYPDGAGNVGGLTTPGFARIFKCDAVDRTGVDRNVRDGFAGRLNANAVTPAGLGRLTEYLWQFVFFEAAHSKVLATFSLENATAYEHTLMLAFAFRRATDQCDRIEVIDWTFTADKQTGELHKKFVLHSAFGARFVNGAPQLCQ